MQNVAEAVVRIVVMANIQINPPVAYLLAQTFITYRVQIVKQNRVTGLLNFARYAPF